MSDLAHGQRYGQWELDARIGRGGNGQVWSVTGPAGERAALKVLIKTSLTAYKRFRDEIYALKSTKGIVGILPVLDEFLPETVGEAKAWYAMPLAVPAEKSLHGKGVRAIVSAVAEVAETLSSVHERGFGHRDVKPENLLFFDGRMHVGDFGLVDYPGKEDLSGSREVIGPKWTMAPEMRRRGDDADAKPADVYSLAKTLWILITKIQDGFDGAYVRRSGHSIVTYCHPVWVSPLEDLIEECTRDEPADRPTMQAVAARLREWLKSEATFAARNRLQWEEALAGLFPLLTPSRAIWHDVDEMVGVLNYVSQRSNLNHLLFPRMGGLDLRSATISEREPGCVELNTQGQIHIVKPKRLLFEYLGPDAQWSFFRLETGGLEPSGIYEDLAGFQREELTDVGGLTYADRGVWDLGVYEGEPLPENSRHLTRHFEGTFLVVQKSSVYNRDPRTYDGRHNRMDADEFRAYMTQYRDAFERAQTET